MKEIKCTGCDKGFKDYNAEYVNFLGSSRNYIFKFHKECEKNAMEIIDDKFLVEEYRNHKIYCVDGGYIPYAGCAYCFNTLKDCKQRIDDGLDNKVVIASLGAMQTVLGGHL